MFGPRIQQYARRIAEMVVSPLAAIGMTPNMATLLGLLLNAVAAAIIATGNLRIGGAMLLFAGLFDMVDGALARIRNQKTTFGAFLDSTLDRYSEGIVLLGMILYALTIPAEAERTWISALAYIAALSSLMVSYARARAEGLGMSLKSGLMARPERILVLALGLMIGGSSWLGLIITLGILAVTSTFTAIQRIVTVWLRLRAQPAEASSPASTTERASAEQTGDAMETQAQAVAQPAIGIKLVPRWLRAAASDTVTSERSPRR